MPAGRSVPLPVLLGYRLVMLMALLMPLPVIDLGVGLAALLVWSVDARGRRGVQANMRALGRHGWGARRAGLAVYVSFVRYLIEFLGRRRFLDLAFMRPRVSGLHRLRRLAHGRGVVVAGAHFGNTWFSGAFPQRHGLPTACIVSPAHIALLDEVLPRRWRLPGQEMIPVDRALREGARCLRRRPCVLVMAVDRPAGSDALATRIAGHAAQLSTIPARLAVRSGAVLLTGYALRRSWDRYVFYVGRPLEGAARGSTQERVEALVHAQARELERLLRAHPEQWHVFQPLLHRSVATVVAQEPAPDLVPAA